jgi:hypothetical protein
LVDFFAGLAVSFFAAAGFLAFGFAALLSLTCWHLPPTALLRPLYHLREK